MDLYRTEGVLNKGRVGSQKLMVLGCGSLGSLVVGNLVYPWRQIVLVDPNELKVENLERHLLNQQRWVGQPKVTALAEWLEGAGLDPATIVAYQGRAQAILADHTDADLLLVNLDRRGDIRDINAWCYEHNVPAFYGGIYPKGSGGEIMVVTKPREACYNCGDYLNGSGTTTTEGEPNYAVDITRVVDNDLDIQAVPALRAPISQVASTMALFALEFLQAGELEAQIYRLGCAAWEPMGSFAPGKILDHFTQHLDVRQQMGLVRTMKLEEGVAGAQTLLLRYGTMPLHLRQWSKCSLHSERVDASDI